MSRPSSGRAAIRYGAPIGLVWGVLLAVNYYLVLGLDVRFTSIASLIIALAIYLVAGILAAAQAGTVVSGLLAGLWTGLISSVVNAIGVIIILVSDHALIDKLRQTAIQATRAAGVSGTHVVFTDGIILVSAIVGLVIGLIIATVVGLGVGALGGLIGRSRAPGAPQPQAYQEAMYRGLPPTGQ